MVNNRQTILMTTEQDIDQLILEGTAAPSQIMNGVTVRYLPYRYIGELRIDRKNLVFKGFDIKEEKNYEMVLPLYGIIDIYLGFGEGLADDSNAAFAFKGPLPFVVRHQFDSVSKTLYFTTTPNNALARRNNLEWYINLGKVVTGNRHAQLHNWRNPSLVMAK